MATATTTAINFMELGTRLACAMSAASAGAPAPIYRSGLLVILDMHGVMVERVSRRDRAQYSRTKQRRNPWITFKHHGVWLRPHLQTFLHIALTRHEIGLWSSAQRNTIEQFLHHLSADDDMHLPLIERLSFVWDRDRCRLDSQTGRYSTVKYLKDLWDCEAFGGKYTSANTLLLDDSQTKFRHFPSSGMLVPEYREDKLRDQYNTDDTLLWLLIYIEYVFQVSNKSLEAGEIFDISACRPECINFLDFMREGKEQAYKILTGKENISFKSLALVFIRGISASNVLAKNLQQAMSSASEMQAVPSTSSGHYPPTAATTDSSEFVGYSPVG